MQIALGIFPAKKKRKRVSNTYAHKVLKAKTLPGKPSQMAQENIPLPKKKTGSAIKC